MAAGDAPRIVLVEAGEHLPGLFPLHAWDVLRAAPRVHVRDLDHPSVLYLQMGAVDVAALEPGRVDLAGMSLNDPGSLAERRAAQGLVDRATADGTAVYLLAADETDDFTRAVGLAATKAHAEVEFVFYLSPPAGMQVLRLAAIEARLRDPVGGCPWDLEQDQTTLGHYLVEETYELLDAIDASDDAGIAEELGDVLLQVVFQAQIAADRGAFTLDDVARGIADKLVHRHPHVFGDVEVSGAAEVKANWEDLKQAEKTDRTGPFDGIPTQLPALQLAEKVLRRAEKAGREAADGGPDVDAIARAAAAVAGAEQLEPAFGELLIAVVRLARRYEVDPEQALRRAVGRLRERVEASGSR